MDGDGQGEAEGAVINGILDEEGEATVPGALVVHPINSKSHAR